MYVLIEIETGSRNSKTIIIIRNYHVLDSSLYTLHVCTKPSVTRSMVKVACKSERIYPIQCNTCMDLGTSYMFWCNTHKD